MTDPFVDVHVRASRAWRAAKVALHTASHSLPIVGSASVALTLALPAQVVRGRVVDSLTGARVGRGFVVLLDATGNEVARTLTSGTAEFLLRAPSPGQYRLRSELIGYRAAVSAALSLASGASLEYTIEIAPLPIPLSAVEVQAETRCKEDPALAAATGVVWEEIRKALEAAAWDGRQRPVGYRYYRFERDLSADRRRVTREAGRVIDGSADRPFGSLPAEQLARDGYIVSQRGEIHYALPDAEVLLHPSFLRTHCFHVVREPERRAGEIGLAFRPVERRRVADVRGTMWLDEATAELKTLEISYTELPEDVEDPRAGGTLGFLRAPSGAWIVERWELRTPVMRVVQRLREAYSQRVRTDARVVGWRDFGGDVLEIRSREQGVVYPARLAHADGTASDTSGCRPLAGAVVALEGTPFSTTTDGSGHFHLAVPVEGDYGLTVSHARIDSTGQRVEPQVVSLSRGAVQHVTIMVPRTSAGATAVCSTGVDRDEAPAPGSSRALTTTVS